jgi:hypothetical protein
MSVVGSSSGTRRPVTPESLTRPESITPDEDGDTLIPEIQNNITLARITKVITPLKFNSKSAKLKEFLTKIKIYLNYNNKSFELKDNKTIFIILYLKELVFDFISTYI